MQIGVSGLEALQEAHGTMSIWTGGTVASWQSAHMNQMVSASPAQPNNQQVQPITCCAADAAR